MTDKECPLSLTLFQIPPCYICPFTCSSNRLITAWTHSTGLCAAMVRRMLTAGAPPPGSPKSEPRRLIQRANQATTRRNLTAKKHKQQGLAFSLRVYSTVPPWHTTGSLNPSLSLHSLVLRMRTSTGFGQTPTPCVWPEQAALCGHWIYEGNRTRPRNWISPRNAFSFSIHKVSGHITYFSTPTQAFLWLWSNCRELSSQMNECSSSL